MKKKYSFLTLGSTAILLSALSTSSFAAKNDAQTAGYCASPLLYATNIRENCAQYGAEGLAGLYQRSEFISKLKPSSDPKLGKARDFAS